MLNKLIAQNRFASQALQLFTLDATVLSISHSQAPDEEEIRRVERIMKPSYWDRRLL